MSKGYDSLLVALARKETLRSQQKEQKVAESTARKRQELDPNFEIFNPDLYDIIDGDSLRHKRTGEQLRLQGPEGTSFDTFETNPATYERNKKRFGFHQRAYAQQFGRDPNDISITDLNEAGLAQKQGLRDRIELARGKGFYRNAPDQYGRSLVSFEDQTIARQLQPISAGYFAPSNYKELATQVASGEFQAQLPPEDRSALRAFTGDAAVNFGVGALRMASELLQASSVITGVGNFKPVQDFFSWNRQGLDSIKNALSSEAQLFRERLDKKESAFLAPVYTAKKYQFMKDNPDSPEWQAALYAGTDEAIRRIEYLIENPGRILDATIESLPYMLGVGAAGRAASVTKLRSLQGKAFKEFAAIESMPVTARAAQYKKFLSSTFVKNEIAKTATRTGITTIGLSEGLTTSADVYASISSMTEEEAQQSADYRQLRASGLTHQKAVNKLARAAFTETLLTVTILAAIAAAGTGAAAFESSLFTGLRRSVITGNTKKSILRKTAGGIIGPGLRETVEESIQSGGGELVSQYTSKKATGKDVGPGVGAAAGEGGLIGLASGSGLASVAPTLRAVSKGARKAADVAKNAKRNRTLSTEPTGVQLGTEDEIAVGGNANSAEKTILDKRGTTDNDTLGPVLKILDETDNGKREKRTAAYPIKELIAYYSEFLRDPQGASTETKNETEQRVNQFVAEYKTALKIQADEISDNYTSDEIIADPKKLAILRESARLQNFKVKDESGKLGEFLSSARAITIAMKKADAVAAENSELAAQFLPTGKSIEQVTEEKMGDGINAEGQLGLRAHIATITEAVDNRNKVEFTKRMQKLNKFLLSARKSYKAFSILESKIRKLDNPSKEQIADIEVSVSKQSGIKVSWSPPAKSGFLSGTPALIKLKGNELDSMIAVQQALINYASVKFDEASAESLLEGFFDPFAVGAVDQSVATTAIEANGSKKPEPAGKDNKVIQKNIEEPEATPELDLNPLDSIPPKTTGQEAQPDAPEGVGIDITTTEENSNDEQKAQDQKEVQEDQAENEEIVKTSPELEIPGLTDPLKPIESAKRGKYAPEVSNEPELAPASSGATIPITPKGPSKDQVETLITATTTIAEGKGVVSTLTTKLQQAVNFTGGTVAKYLGPLVGQFKDPNSEWSEQELSATKKQIRKRFALLKLPVSLLQSYTDKNTKISNLLLAVPNFFSIVQKSAFRTKFYRAANANTKEEQGMNGVIVFATKFMNTLDQLHLGMLNDRNNKNTLFRDGTRKNGKPNKVGKEEAAIVDRLQSYLLTFLMDGETGRLDESIASIMALEGGNWLSNGGASTLNKKDSAILAFAGLNAQDEVTNDMRKVLGNGTLHTQVASQIGQKVIAQSNLKLKGMDNLSNSFQDRLAISIGNMVTATMATMGQIELSKISAQYQNMSVDQEQTDAEITLIYSKPINSRSEDTDLYTEIEINTKLREDFQSANRILNKFFDMKVYERGPVFEPATAPIKLANGLSNVERIQQDNIESNQAEKWSANLTMTNEFGRWSKDGLLKHVMGQISEEDIKNNTHSTQVLATRSKNDRNIRSYQQVIDWLSTNNTKTFYFIYRMIRSHRIMIDSNTINPEADKLHRSIFGMRKWKVRMSSSSLVPNSKTNKARLEAFKIAMALAMDIDIEGQTTKDIIAEFDTFINAVTVQEAIKVLNSVDKDNTYTSENEAIIGAALALREGADGPHMLQGLRSWADFIKADGKPVTIYLPMEEDGKTNGYASLLMQIMPNSIVAQTELNEFYNGVGIFFNESADSSYAEYIKKGGQDNYNNVTDRSEAYINDMRNGQIPLLNNNPAIPMNQEEVNKLAELLRDRDYAQYSEYKIEIRERNKEWQSSEKLVLVLNSAFIELNRNFAKGPLTQVAYSAGMPGVRNDIKRTALRNFYEQMGQAGQDPDGTKSVKEIQEEIAHVMARMQSVILAAKDRPQQELSKIYKNMLQVVAQYTTKSELIKYRTNYELQPTSEESFLLGIDLTYGHALQAALEEKLKSIKPVTDMMNDTVYLANLIFIANFKERINQAEKLAGEVFTDTQRKQILNRMIREGQVPMIKTPLSRTQMDGLLTTSTGTVLLAGEQKGRAYFKKEQQIHTVKYDKDGKTSRPAKVSSTTSRLVGIEPNMNIGVAAIAMATHASDGSVNGTMMGKFGILNLFDAFYGNFEQSAERGQIGNKTFFETHRNWNMPQEFLNSMKRMLPLLDPNSTQLSKQVKINILNDFLEQRIKFSKVSRETNASTHLNIFLDYASNMVNENNKARKLFYSRISSVNQFVGPNTMYEVPTTTQVSQQDTGEIPAANLNKLSVVANINKVGGLLNIIRSTEANVFTRRKAKIIQELTRQVKEGGNTREIINNYLKTSPRAQDVLDVLYVAYRDRGDSEIFRDMVNSIRPMLNLGRGEHILVVLGQGSAMQDDDGRFYPDTNIIELRSDSRNPFGTLLHELIHAANVKQILKLEQQTNKTAFNNLLNEAKLWMRNNLQAIDGSPEQKAAFSIKTRLEAQPDINFALTASEKIAFKARQEAFAISEYVAHLNTEMSFTEDGFKFHFHTAEKTTEVSRLLARSLQTPANNKVLYSSAEDVNENLFTDDDAQSLTQVTLMEAFEEFKAAESVKVTPEMQSFYDKLITKFISPGLQSIDSLIYKLAIDKNGKRNIGKILVKDGESTIFLQATAKNKYSSALDMGLQEVAIHEILHGVFEYALSGNGLNGEPRIQRQVEKLYDQVSLAINKKYGQDGWKAFMPKSGLNPALDEKLARERYDHIFGIPKISEQNRGYHEFMAIGLSNPQFIEILQNIDTAPAGPIFGSGKLFTTFMNLLAKVWELIRLEIFNAESANIHQGLEKLASNIITVNIKNQELAQKKYNEGFITGRLSRMNDAAVRKLAELASTKIKQWADKNSKSGIELDASIEDLGAIASMVVSAKSATASVLATNTQAFREAFDAAVTNKTNPLYDLLTEIIPWADRNRNWIDAMRRAEVLVDGNRQQMSEHSRTGMLKMFDPKTVATFTIEQREAITNVIWRTDLSALLTGDPAIQLDAGQILDIIKDPTIADMYIQSLEAQLDKILPAKIVNSLNTQSQGLANLLMTGKGFAHLQQVNVFMMVKMAFKHKSVRPTRPLNNEKEVSDILEHLTTLRAFKHLPKSVTDNVAEIMNKEMSRGLIENGFTGQLGLSLDFKKLSAKNLFDGSEISRWKGYVKEIFDEETSIKAVPYTPGTKKTVMTDMEKDGWEFIKDLPRAKHDYNPVTLMLFKQERGIPGYAASSISITSEQQVGTGLYQSAFMSGMEGSKRQIAAITHARLAKTKRAAYKAAEAQANTSVPTDDLILLPTYNQDMEIVDFRYIMTEDSKRIHLKKRNYFDEIVPGMLASLVDKTNSKLNNELVIKEMYKEYAAYKKNKTKPDNIRYVAIGPNVSTKEGQEKWQLLPKDAQIMVRNVWGSDLLYIRDDVVNLIFGFRKMTVSNLKGLGAIAPAARIAEKIWQEIIQWERFRIAVLNPVVVIGNVVSNIALLLSQGIPPAYIIREAQVAIFGMRKYQKDVRARNELNTKVRSARALGLPTRIREAELARLQTRLDNNPVQSLVAEGLFTSIVEEFGMDENSTRRKLTTKVLNSIKNNIGIRGSIKVAQEAFMIPGSETAQLALMATQYGDFVARFIKFKWDTQVKKVPYTKAIREALDTFIYYNIPQNRRLQYLNDMGLLMFTKFFFRIQPIIARTFTRNPVQTSIILGLQAGLNNRTAGENIFNYALMDDFGGKFRFNPATHLIDGEMFVPSSLKWLQLFTGE